MSVSRIKHLFAGRRRLLADAGTGQRKGGRSILRFGPRNGSARPAGAAGRGDRLDRVAVINYGDKTWEYSLGSGIPGGGNVNFQAVYTIPPGGTRQAARVVVQPFAQPAGTYTGTATVDPDNRVAEADETNNTIECVLTIAPATTAP